MTPQLEAALAAIQPLSASERQQLLNLMSQLERSTANVSLHLCKLNQDFWQGVELQELRQFQQPRVVHQLDDLTADFWPEEESLDDFLDFLQQQRQVVS